MIKSKEKLKDIIEKYPYQCVLIFEDLDTAPHMKDEVLGIVQGAKFHKCTVLVMTRPHYRKEIEIPFNIVANVKGFSLSQAEQFVRSIVHDENKAHDVLNFNPSGKRSEYKVPIWLITCSLVTSGNLDLSDKTLESEVLFRMLYYLYNVFVKRKGKDFEENYFFEMLMSLGELALEPVSSEKYTQIIEKVLEKGHDCGFLIVREVFKWIPNKNGKNVDISVTFLDPSIQVFLGAFYFILSLGKNQTIHLVDETLSDYLKNGLFVQVCLWLLDKDNVSFHFPEREEANKRLIYYASCGTLDYTKLVSQRTRYGKNEKALKTLALLAWPNYHEQVVHQNANLVNGRQMMGLVSWPCAVGDNCPKSQ